MTLLTLLILTVCRMYVVCGLCNEPCSPQSLWGSVAEYQSMDSKGMRFDSTWGLRTFSLPHAYDKTTKHLSLTFEKFVNLLPLVCKMIETERRCSLLLKYT